MNEKPKDIKTIFAEALEKHTPQERAAYLDEACGDDAALRSKVEELLKSHDQAGSFLEFEDLHPEVTLAQAPPSEHEGTVIGPYKLLERIGEGGMAYVYMAEQTEPIRRRVALKIIKLGMDTKQVIARFEAERQALAMMDHPNIAKVFDAGATETGRPYFVMELVKGVIITDYCDNNKLDTKERLALFIQVCNAVQHAHQKGIIHRDIKPTNVMVTLHDGKPVPKVIDFGIAKATSQRLTEKTVFTRYAQMIGTPEYMSPEQAEFSGLDIDTRSDIYSLGVLLYELLTGATPFDAEVLRAKGYGEMQRIIRETEPVKPSTKLSTMGDALTDIADHRKTSPDLLAKLVRGDLDWIVMKTLEKDRTRRYEAVNALTKDIQRHLDSEPVEAGPPSTIYRIRKFVQKRRKTVAAVATIAALLIIGLIVSTTLYLIAEKARTRETLARAAAEKTEKTATEKAESLRRANYVNSIQLADAKYKEGNIRHVHELLADCPNDLREWEWNRLNHVADQSIITIGGHQDVIRSVAVSPDGKSIVSVSEDNNIKIWDTVKGIELTKISRSSANKITCVAVSPDGKRIASAEDSGNINVFDMASGRELMTLENYHSRISSITFSPDGSLLSGDLDSMVKVWDAATGTEVMTLKGHKNMVCSVAFSPDSRQIVSSCINDPTVKVWDIASGNQVMTLTGHDCWARYVSFSPNGKFIVSAEDTQIKIWDATTSAELMTLHGHNGSIVCVTFSPDSKCVATGGMDSMIKVWAMPEGEEMMTFRGHEYIVDSVAFTPDGKYLVSGSYDGTIKIWDVSLDRETARLSGHNHPVGSVVFSPDGNYILTGSWDGTAKIWNVRTSSETMTLAGQEGVAVPGDAISAEYSPDGKRVASVFHSGTVKIWDVTTGRVLMTLCRDQCQQQQGLAFSADSNYLAAGGKVWNAQNGTEVMTLYREGERVRCVTFSPDGRSIASGDHNGTLKVWDVGTGEELLALHGHEGRILQIAFSPDGNRMISAGDGTKIKVWDTKTGDELMLLHGHADIVISVRFSPDGKRLVSGSRDGTAKIWDATTGAELLTLRADAGVSSVAFSPDGKTVAAGTFGGEVMLWESKYLGAE